MTHQAVDNELGSFDPERQENVVQSKYAPEVMNLVNAANEVLRVGNDETLGWEENVEACLMLEACLRPFQTEGA